MKIKVLLATLLGLLLVGCIPGLSGDDEKEDPAIDLTKGPDDIVVGSCSENLTIAQKRVGDSLVALANEQAVSSIQDMAEELDQGEWERARTLTPSEAFDLYDKALIAAPGHCGALFGKTVASVIMTMEDPELDEFVNHVQDVVDSMDASEGGTSTPKRAFDFLNITPTKAPVALLKLSRGLANTAPVTVKEVQDLVANTIIPKLDSAIARMTTILAYGAFEFNLTITDDDGTKHTVQLDNGEVGPLLAGTKVALAFCLAIVSHNVDDLMVDGDYKWIESLTELDDNSLDNLTADQRRYLDHAKSLTAAGSNFTRIRTEWKSRWKGVPALLLGAIGDFQAGLQKGIDESKDPVSTQENDPYRVGKGAEDDVDPADFTEAITQLEKSKKYLQGEVTLTYAKGTKTIKINLPKFFDIDGYQGLLPYFAWNPYEEWNDIVRSDTDWYSDETGQRYVSDISETSKGPIYFTNAAGVRTLGFDDDVQIDSILDFKGKIIFRDPTFGGIFPDLTADNIWETVASMEDLQPRLMETCMDWNTNTQVTVTSDQAHEGDYWDCQYIKPGAGASDLDWLIYYLDGGAEDVMAGSSSEPVTGQEIAP